MNLIYVVHTIVYERNEGITLECMGIVRTGVVVLFNDKLFDNNHMLII